MMDVESINGLWYHVKIKDLVKAKFMLLIITNRKDRWLMQKSLALKLVSYRKPSKIYE